MIVPVNAQSGLTGTPRSVGSIILDTSAVQGVASWAGSYHIIDMGRHYQDYVLGSALPPLPQLAAIPASYPYERLGTKTRATGVTGNIGEGVAALFARRIMGLTLADIAHVKIRKPFKRRKVPDYLMRLNPFISPMVSVLRAAGPFSGAPEWWPVESKARCTDADAAGARRDALMQLAACWTELRVSDPSAVGFGLIVTFCYRVPREVRATFITPRNQASLSTVLDQDEPAEWLLRNCLYGC
jgi:hypothetical protein